jgi:hypothetical protein
MLTAALSLPLRATGAATVVVEVSAAPAALVEVLAGEADDGMVTVRMR